MATLKRYVQDGRTEPCSKEGRTATSSPVGKSRSLLSPTAVQRATTIVTHYPPPSPFLPLQILLRQCTRYRTIVLGTNTTPLVRGRSCAMPTAKRQGVDIIYWEGIGNKRSFPVESLSGTDRSSVFSVSFRPSFRDNIQNRPQWPPTPPAVRR